MLDVAIVAFTDRVITVEIDGRAHDLHALWLRDACGCVGCRHAVTHERLVDAATIVADLTIVSAAVEGECLTVRLSDDHDSRINLDRLTRHLDDADRSNDPAAGRNLWVKSPTILTLDRDDLDDPATMCAWLDAITQNGAAIVRGVEPTDAGLREVAARIGEIRATNYGVTWTIEATVEPVTAVESERHLRAHTDLPYRDVAPGVQFLLAAISDVEGGASTLIDGYAIAEQLRQTNPDAWRLLTQVEFSYPFLRDDVELHGRAPLIGLRSNGSYFQIRRAPDLVGAPFVDAASAPDLYRALGLWTNLIDDADVEARVRLEPGDLLAFDNHRLLHGRTAFDLGTAGRRRLHGCYLDIEDLRSRRAVAARTI